MPTTPAEPTAAISDRSVRWSRLAVRLAVLAVGAAGAWLLSSGSASAAELTAPAGAPLTYQVPGGLLPFPSAATTARVVSLAGAARAPLAVDPRAAHPVVTTSAALVSTAPLPVPALAALSGPLPSDLARPLTRAALPKLAGGRQTTRPNRPRVAPARLGVPGTTEAGTHARRSGAAVPAGRDQTMLHTSTSRALRGSPPSRGPIPRVPFPPDCVPGQGGTGSASHGASSGAVILPAALTRPADGRTSTHSAASDPLPSRPHRPAVSPD